MAVRNWPSKVTWAKFKKVDKPLPGHTTDAHIEAIYTQPPGRKFQPVKAGKHFKLTRVNLVLKLVPAETWVVKGKPNKALLNHEQGHWDIIGLIAREYHNELKNLKGDTLRQLLTRFRALEARMQAKIEKLNSGTGGYDTDTNHGLNKAQQKRWDGIIDTCKRTGKNLPDK